MSDRVSEILSWIFVAWYMYVSNIQAAEFEKGCYILILLATLLKKFSAAGSRKNPSPSKRSLAV